MGANKDSSNYKLPYTFTPLTQEQKDDIQQMFWGPYKDGWRDKKGIVDNRDETIANRLNLEKTLVVHYIIKINEEHFKRVFKLRESEEFHKTSIIKRDKMNFEEDIDLESFRPYYIEDHPMITIEIKEYPSKMNSKWDNKNIK